MIMFWKTEQTIEDVSVYTDIWRLDFSLYGFVMKVKFPI